MLRKFLSLITNIIAPLNIIMGFMLFFYNQFREQMITNHLVHFIFYLLFVYLFYYRDRKKYFIPYIYFQFFAFGALLLDGIIPDGIIDKNGPGNTIILYITTLFFIAFSIMTIILRINEEKIGKK